MLGYMYEAINLRYWLTMYIKLAFVSIFYCQNSLNEAFNCVRAICIGAYFIYSISRETLAIEAYAMLLSILCLFAMCETKQ